MKREKTLVLHVRIIFYFSALGDINLLLHAQQFLTFYVFFLHVKKKSRIIAVGTYDSLRKFEIFRGSPGNSDINKRLLNS